MQATNFVYTKQSFPNASFRRQILVNLNLKSECLTTAQEQAVY